MRACIHEGDFIVHAGMGMWHIAMVIKMETVSRSELCSQSHFIARKDQLTKHILVYGLHHINRLIEEHQVPHCKEYINRQTFKKIFNPSVLIQQSLQWILSLQWDNFDLGQQLTSLAMESHNLNDNHPLISHAYSQTMPDNVSPDCCDHQ